MENENLQQTNHANNARSIRDILFILRKNIALMLAVFFIILGVGAVYTLAVNEGYTAQELVILDIKNKVMDGTQEEVSDLTRPNVNTIAKWRHTIFDFCDSGVVLDRANYYYSEYKKSLEAGYVKDVDVFVKNISSLIADSKVEKYNLQASPVAYSASKIEITGVKEDEIDGFGTFLVNYVDDNEIDARDKVRILVLAFSEEVQVQEEVDGKLESKYFGGMQVYINTYGVHDTFSNKKVLANVIVTVLLGAVLAFVSVYLKTVLDNTIKAKEDLEKITGAFVLSAIENKE